MFQNQREPSSWHYQALTQRLPCPSFEKKYLQSKFGNQGFRQLRFLGFLATSRTLYEHERGHHEIFKALAPSLSGVSYLSILGRQC